MKDLRCLSDWTDMTLFHHLHKFEHWQVPSKCLHPKQIFVSAEQTWAVSKQCTHPLCLSVYMHLCISVCGGSDSDNYQELKELCGYFPPHHFLFFCFVFFSNSWGVNVLVKRAHFQLLFAHVYTAQCKFCCVCYCEWHLNTDLHCHLTLHLFAALSLRVTRCRTM